MKSKIFSYLNFFILTSCLLVISYAYPFLGKATGRPDSNVESQHSIFRVLACIAWWSHDAVGYHPAMFLMLDNISGQDINGEEIPFQSRFTDLRNGYITVARDYKRTPVHNHERFVLLLRAPQSFELPIDSNLWPSMECKAMCRLPHRTGGDPQVDDLFVTHVSRITMTDEDAHAALVSQAERNPLLALREPLLSEEIDKPNIPNEKTKSAPAKLPKHLPKIGDDFYALEQLYGKAYEFQPGTSGSIDDLTWTHYQAQPPLFDMYAGSRNASKIDVVIVTISTASIPKEFNALSLAKVLAGCRKEEHISPFVHSVRYLAAGRSEIMTTGIRDCRILSFPLNENEGPNNKPINKTVIFVTRLPGDPEAALDTYIKHVNFLHLSN